MKVILIRHGEAEWETSTDAKRQLTQLGQQQAVETAEYILDKYEPDTYIVSTYTRAQQTLSAFSEKRPNVPVFIKEGLTPSDDPVKALKSLMDIKGDCVVIVCHMPIVAKLAALLVGNDPNPYSLAEARVIEAEFIAADMGTEIDCFVPVQY